MQQQKILHGVIDSLSDAILLEGIDRKIVVVNKKFCTLFGINANPDELVGLDCTKSAEMAKELFEFPEQFVGRVNEIMKSGVPIYEEQLRLKSGKIYKRDYVPIFENDTPAGHLWKYNDITEKIQTQNKLIEQREYYENILNNIPLDIVLLDKHKRFEFVSKRAIKNDEMRAWAIGKTNMEYCNLKPQFDPSIGKNRDEMLSKVTESKKSSGIVEKFVLPDGKIQSIYRVHTPIIDKNNEIDYYIIYGVDITEQIETKFFVDVQEKRIANMLYMLRDGVFRCDIDGSLNLFNDSFLKIHDLQRPQSGNLNYFEILPVEFLDQFKEQLQTLKKTGNHISGIYKMRDSRGELRYIDYLFTKAIRDEDAAFVGRVTDATAQITKEHVLEEAIEKEKKLNNAKSNFLRIASHELRTPLAIIVSNAEILELLLQKISVEGLKVDPNVALGRILRESSSMTQIVDQLLTLSKIEEGKLELNIEEINLLNLVNEIREVYFNPSPDGRSLSLDISSKLQTFPSDLRLIRYIILNLLNNAFKYSVGRQAPVLIIYQVGDILHIEVRDFGIGIPKEEIKNLFTPYFRSSNAQSINGTGIGLTVLEYSVKILGGEIAVESELNQGTTFRVNLPKILNYD